MVSKDNIKYHVNENVVFHGYQSLETAVPLFFFCFPNYVSTFLFEGSEFWILLDYLGDGEFAVQFSKYNLTSQWL